MPPMELYGLIHQRWGESLAKENISTCLMPCPDKSKGGIPGDCFKEPVGRDLMNGEGTLKLGGAAMKAYPQRRVNPRLFRAGGMAWA